MDRVILHSDCNCFYASVEMLHHPELAGRPLAVGGEPEQRHGIILTANYIAKKQGVKTGTALWQAKQVCPDIVFLPPRMYLYLRFSKMVREIYADYTDKQESFGIDECWLDVTESAGAADGSGCSIKEGEKIACEIGRRVREELGITVSVGVSWNKIYAKLGSDYRKPDAVTVFDRNNYRGKIWPLPASDLLYVGRATERKLRNYGILTIGDLAEADPYFLQRRLGKAGLMLSMFARGEDQTPVSWEQEELPIKSVGNGTTTPRDLVDDEDVKLVIYLLAESVSKRLRQNGLIGDVIEIYVRDKALSGCVRQHKIRRPTNISGEIAEEAFRLFKELYSWHLPVRSITVRVAHLYPEDYPAQLDLFVSEERRERLMRVDRAVDEIRGRFGYHAVRRGILSRDPYLASLNAAADDHMIHPHGYMERGNRTGVEFYRG